MDYPARLEAAREQHTRHPAARCRICDRDHERAGPGLLGPAYRKPVNVTGRRVVVEEYGGLHRGRHGGRRASCVSRPNLLAPAM